MQIKDIGPEPQSFDLEEATRANRTIGRLRGVAAIFK